MCIISLKIHSCRGKRRILPSLLMCPRMRGGCPGPGLLLAPRARPALCFGLSALALPLTGQPHPYCASLTPRLTCPSPPSWSGIHQSLRAQPLGTGSHPSCTPAHSTPTPGRAGKGYWHRLTHLLPLLCPSGANVCRDEDPGEAGALPRRK